MGARQLAAGALRRVAPRTVKTLETLPDAVRQLSAELAELRGRAEETARDVGALRADLESVRADVATLRTDLHDARVRGGAADDAIARLTDRVGALDAGVTEIDSGLAESRRLSLRVAQMTDLVFDRLGQAAPRAPER